MIPVKLKLSNFTSYGENPPELDFSQFKMAAISGLNGAGKSSLLDAITWALWGTSRAGDSSDALIRLGAEQMEVEFSFELDGHIYTVKRKRIKKHGGNTSLELWSNTHNLTEGTIKATQQKIINTLHLTFETFINSSFIRQGHADEFTTKGPSDRKRILADILGLDHYDKLEEKAKEKAKDANTKLQLLDYQLLEIEAELSQKEEREKNFNIIQQEVEKAKAEVKEIEEFIKTIEEEKQAVQVTVNTLLEQKKRFENLNQELTDLKVQLELKEKSKNEYQVILDKKELIEQKYNELQTLKEQKQTLEVQRSELLKVKNELIEIEKTINTRKEGRNKAISDLEIQTKSFQTKSESLEKQNQILKDQKTICPTCNQPIGAEKNQEIILKNNQEIAECQTQIQQLNQKIEKYNSIVFPEEELAKQKEIEVKNIEDQTKDYFELNTKINELLRFEQGFMKLQQAEVGVKTHQEAILDLQKILASKTEEISKAQTFEQDLSTFSQKLSEISLKLSSQASIKESLNRKVLELTGQAGQAKQLIDRASQMENLLQEKTKQKTELSSEKSVYETLAEAFGKKGIQAMIIENAIPEIEDEANKLLEKLTEGRMQVRFETQKETKTKVLKESGKKERGIVETLDIIISDEMGERSYEMYSGGETFRVNFAIRLAISKLLTHRAGARLQFLVIDEGFGTQDAAGRARLVEVIDTIKSDFEKILVITHIEELKAEFPTRIEVSKSPTGSIFEVVGV